MAKVTQWLT